MNIDNSFSLWFSKVFNIILLSYDHQGFSIKYYVEVHHLVFTKK